MKVTVVHEAGSSKVMFVNEKGQGTKAVAENELKSGGMGLIIGAHVGGESTYIHPWVDVTRAGNKTTAVFRMPKPHILLDPKTGEPTESTTITWENGKVVENTPPVAERILVVKTLFLSGPFGSAEITRIFVSEAG